jgi:predicted Zn-ribbon and HTH transcriptional regulator
MKIGSNQRYVDRIVGQVDRKTIEKAKGVGIENIAGGSINKTHKHVLIFIKGVFPGAHRSGYAMRSRVVWWLNTGEVVVGDKIDIHHDDEDKTNDRFSNLKRLEHLAHAHHHHPKGLHLVQKNCIKCGIAFKIDRWRLKDPSRGRFCSQGCYHAQTRSEEHTMAISEGLKLAYAEGRR